MAVNSGSVIDVSSADFNANTSDITVSDSQVDVKTGGNLNTYSGILNITSGSAVDITDSGQLNNDERTINMSNSNLNVSDHGYANVAAAARIQVLI